MYKKEFTFQSEYTAYVRLVKDSDGIRLEWKEETDKEFPIGLCLSNKDIGMLIKMLQEIGPEFE